MLCRSRAVRVDSRLPHCSMRALLSGMSRPIPGHGCGAGPSPKADPLEPSLTTKLSGARKRRPVWSRLVYARHGHELMGCKSPVGDPALSIEMMATTSRRQGRHREVSSEGSPSAKVRADEQKRHRRPGPRASQHNMTKPTGVRGQGKCRGCAGTVHALIRGDLLDKRSDVAMGAGLRPRRKRTGPCAPEPLTRSRHWQPAADGGNPWRDRAEVSRGHSRCVDLERSGRRRPEHR